MDLTTRELTVDELDAAFDVRTSAFGPSGRGDWWDRLQRELTEAGRTIGVYDGDRLVAHAKTRPFQQYWGGRALPMAGVAGVVVLPEYRGRGVGSLLMRALTEQAVERGDVLSALYPATVPVYRHLGWELVGAQTRYTFPADALRRLSGSDIVVRRAGPADRDHVLRVVDTCYGAARASGPKGYSSAEVTTWLEDRDVFCYLTEDGVLFYEWEGSDLRVDLLVAASEASARALWAVVGSGSSIAASVHAYLAPSDAVHLMLPEKAAERVTAVRWMLRLLEVPRAVEGRGFPAGVSVEVPLELTDPLLPANSGSWLLRVRDGAGSLVRQPGSVASRVHLGASGLAAVYAGTPPAVLRVAGLLHGGSPEHDAHLAAAFAATPYLLEYF